MTYLFMAGSSVTNRLHRLDQLKARIQSGESATVRQVAEEFGVSMRTVCRDLEILRDQGLPVEADRGRGGGIRLHRQWGIGRVNFSYAEAVDLLVSLAIAEQMQSPLFMADMQNIRRKLIGSFSAEMKQKVNRLKSRIMVGPTVSSMVFASFSSPDPSVVKILHQTFLLQYRLKIRYRSEQQVVTERCIQPHYLLLCYPIWYVLAWDELRQDVRTFRCDRIMAAHADEEEFRLLPFNRFKGTLEGLETL
ncbi:helix-turn-helix transcriptional regulator [Gynuella sunshinyii]|uniref:Putative transcriptional regulator n=1 Tax=Gynuella sunshinyii YC6258 TaxID=1445510 RepID=A0A0C5VJS4_9GAMM|nr:WYL domain-containing protein [Gynuella sunshinyii]AJQ94917.1 putative transcriptional regulator [Gynuella sunshinyii YC6258]